jgi:hypothetical protein
MEKTPPLRRGRFFLNSLGAYLTYIVFIVGLGWLALVITGLYFQFKSPYLSLILGAVISGFFGVFVVLVRDLQERKRLPEIYLTSLIAADIRNETNDTRIFPLFLENKGYNPGRELLIIISIVASKGNFELSSNSWIEVPYVTISESNYKVYQNRLPGIIYPREAEKPLIAQLIVNPQKGGDYDIEVSAVVYELTSMTSVKYSFTGSNEVDNEPKLLQKEYHAYY